MSVSVLVKKYFLPVGKVGLSPEEGFRYCQCKKKAFMSPGLSLFSIQEKIMSDINKIKRKKYVRSSYPDTRRLAETRK